MLLCSFPVVMLEGRGRGSGGPSPPPLSLTVWTFLPSIPPFTHLLLPSTPPSHRSPALSLSSLVHSFQGGSFLPSSVLLLLPPSSPDCAALQSWPSSLSSFIECHSIPVTCLSPPDSANVSLPVIPCVLEWVLATTPSSLLLYVEPDVFLSPGVSLTFSSLLLLLPPPLHQPPLLVAVSRSTALELRPPLLSAEPLNSSSSLPSFLSVAAVHRVLLHQLQSLRRVAAPEGQSQSQLPPVRATIDLLVTSRAFLLSLRMPPFLLHVGDVAAAAQHSFPHWKEWLLYSALLHSPNVSVVDVSNDDNPLAIFPLSPSTSSPPPPSPLLRSSLSVNARLALSSVPRLFSSSLGPFRSVPLLLQGLCPSCHLQSNPLSSLVSLLLARTSSTNHLLVLHSLDRWALKDFLCWADRLRFTAFIVLTNTKQQQRTLQRQGTPALALTGEEEEEEEDKEEEEGEAVEAPSQSRAWKAGKGGLHSQQRRGLRLTSTLQRLLSFDVTLLVSAGGVIPLSNSLFSQLEGADVQLLSPPSSSSSSPPHSAVAFSALNSSALLSPTLLVLAATETVKAHLTVLSASLSSFLCPALSSSSMTSEANDCATLPPLGGGSLSQPSLTFLPLNPLYYTPLLDYTQRLYAVQGYRPLLVYTGGEWKEGGAEGKRRAMVDWGLRTGEEGEDEGGDIATCKAGEGKRRERSDSAGERKGGEGVEGAVVLSLHLRVLTCCGRVESLQRLLHSLMAVDWTSTPSPSTSSLVSSIDLRFSISVDAPASPALVEVSALFCHGLRSNWTSPHLLRCEVVQSLTPLGLVGQWTSIPSEGREVLVVLEDDLTVTPPFFSFVLHHVLRYHVLPPRDLRLFSLSLQSAHTIVGESAQRRYGETTPERTLRNRTNSRHSSHHYLYQLIGTWGALFFPPHYAEFRLWLTSLRFNASTSSSPLQSPCVPHLLSNQWWQRKRRAVWSVWAIRYAYERGLYSLYTMHTPIGGSGSGSGGSGNLTDLHVLLPVGPSVVVNWREAGMNFVQAKGRSNEGLQQWGSEEELLWLYSEENDPQRLPLFDFHFREIERGDEASLDYRAQTLPATQFDQCWTREDWKGGKKDGRPIAVAQR